MSQKGNYTMSPVVKKKFEILDAVFRSKDGCSVNELSEMLNELTRINSSFNWTLSPEEYIVPKYIDGTNYSRKVIVHSNYDGVDIVEVGYYSNGIWCDLESNEINVVKWGEFPSV